MSWRIDRVGEDGYGRVLRHFVLDAARAAKILRAAAAFGGISPNYGLRRKNQYFPSFWASPDDNHVRVVQRFRNENYDHCPAHRGEIRVVITGDVYSPADQMRALIVTLRRIKQYVQEDSDRLVSEDFAAMMIDEGTDRCSFASPLGAIFRTSVSVRGARMLATRDGINAAGYGRAEAIAKIEAIRSARMAIIDEAIAAAEEAATLPVKE